MWAEFSHDWVEEQKVIYVRGEKLVDLLATRPSMLPAARVDQVAEVIRELAVQLQICPA